MKYLYAVFAFFCVCMALVFFYPEQKAKVTERSAASSSQKASAEVAHVRSAVLEEKENNKPVLTANQAMSERAQEQVSTDFRKVTDTLANSNCIRQVSGLGSFRYEVGSRPETCRGAFEAMSTLAFYQFSCETPENQPPGCETFDRLANEHLEGTLSFPERLRWLDVAAKAGVGPAREFVTRNLELLYLNPQVSPYVIRLPDNPLNPYIPEEKREELQSRSHFLQPSR